MGLLLGIFAGDVQMLTLLQTKICFFFFVPFFRHGLKNSHLLSDQSASQTIPFDATRTNIA